MNTPNDFIIEQVKTEPSVKLSWSKVEDATYYIITRKELNSEEDFKLIAKTKKLFFFDRKLEYNKSYNYKLRAVFDEEIIDFDYDYKDGYINLINTDFKTINFFGEGYKDSDISKTFPFNEFKIVKEDEKQYLKIPKFYYYNDEVEKKILISKIMINYEYELHHAFLTEDEIKDYVLIEINPNQNLKLDKVRTELKENEFIFNFTTLNLLQLLWLVYFQTSNTEVFTKYSKVTNEKQLVELKVFDSPEYNNFFGLINLIGDQKLYIDGCVLDNESFKVSESPFNCNNKGFKYEELTVIKNKNQFVNEIELDYFLPVKTSNKGQHNIELLGKKEEIQYLCLQQDSIFNYLFLNEEKLNELNYRICKYSD